MDWKDVNKYDIFEYWYGDYENCIGIAMSDNYSFDKHKSYIVEIKDLISINQTSSINDTIWRLFHDTNAKLEKIFVSGDNENEAIHKFKKQYPEYFL